MEKARDAYFLEEEMKRLMCEPRISVEQLLLDLDIINANESETSPTAFVVDAGML